MSLTVSNNSFGIQRALAQASQQVQTSQQRVASGQRVNTAQDDAAGLAIATRMQSRLQSMEVAQRNAGDGLSMAQAADAALGQVSEIVTRMKELATQAANATNGAAERANIGREFTELAAEVTRALEGADFNGRRVLAGDAGPMRFIVGSQATDVITATTTNMTTHADITAVTSASVATAAGAEAAMTALDTALNTLTSERALYGAMMSRFDSAVSGLRSQSAALESARSRIMDTDYGVEMSRMQRNQVLEQAATAMLSQANARPQAVLSLLR
jgi:flagellin